MTILLILFTILFALLALVPVWMTTLNDGDLRDMGIRFEH